jgi:hypothetical protein
MAHLLHCWYGFSLSFFLSFFFANFLFCGQITAPYHPSCQWTHPLPRGPTMAPPPTAMTRQRQWCVARTGRDDADMLLRCLVPRSCAPPRHVFAPACAASPCPSQAHVPCHQALITSCATLPCPSRLHVPSRRASQPYALHCQAPRASLRSAGAFFFSFFFLSTTTCGPVTMLPHHALC